MRNGIILKGVGGLYDVYSDDEILVSKVRGHFRLKKIIPIVGDNVLIDYSGDQDAPYVIEEILPRRNSLIRPAVANIEKLLLVFATKNPKPDLKLLDKMLIICSKLDIEPIIVFSKIDLDDSYGEQLREIYSNAGYKVITSSINAPITFQRISELIGNSITSFCGPSGVGKSTICNGLLGFDRMETGDISHKLQRGKHTTRHVELIKLNNGFITDTPGFSSLDLFELGVSYDEIKFGYKEIINRSSYCKFDDCRHINEVGCYIKSVIGEEIDSGRYERYKEFYNLLFSRREIYTK